METNEIRESLLYTAEGGNSILSAFSWEPLPVKLQDN